MTKSKIFFYFCLSFIAGIFAGSIKFFPQLYMLGILILGIVLISVFWQNPKIVFGGFCLIFILAGIWRAQTAELKIKNDEFKKYNDSEKEILLTGKITAEPDIRQNNIKLTVELQNKKAERILVTTNLYPEYKYGDEIKISGRLKNPPIFEDFNYKNYLSKKGILSVMDWPKIEIVEKENYSGFWQKTYGKILDFKNKIRKNINKNFPYPESALFSAMLLGDQGTMPQNMKEKLNITGLRHITAISGMNITILCGILMSFLLGLGFWRGWAFYISLIFIFLFVIMIGFQSSVVRAGIMGIVLLLGQKAGRKAEGLRQVIIAGTIMLIINPLLLAGDVGFQLSFLAILGIILLTGPIENCFKFIPQEKFINLRKILATTLAAQIFTLPILIYNFGRISLVSPLTNILILPIIYWVMLLGFLFGVLGAVWSGLAWFFVWPIYILLLYSTKIIDIFSQPWLAKTIENVRWIWPSVFYLLLGILTWQVKRREKLKFLDYN